MLFLSRLGRQYHIEELRKWYITTFRCPAGAVILPDIAEFCHANEPMPREGDLFKLGIAAGRLDVWLHIKEFLDLDDDELIEVYKGRSIFTRPPKLER